MILLEAEQREVIWSLLTTERIGTSISHLRYFHGEPHLVFKLCFQVTLGCTIVYLENYNYFTINIIDFWSAQEDIMLIMFQIFFFKNLMLEKCTCISPVNMIVDPINCKSICSNHTCFCYHSQIWVTRIYWGSKKRDVKFLQEKSSGNQLLIMFRWKFEVKTFSNKHQTV